MVGLQEKKVKSQERSIRSRIAVPILFVLAIQTLLYVVFLSQGGIVSHMDGNAFDIFSRQTDNLGLYFDNEMIHRWSNINPVSYTHLTLPTTERV